MQHVHKAFRSIVQSTQWMDDVTKAKAINKTDSMKRFISFPESLRNKEEIDNYYSNVRRKYYLISIQKYLFSSSFSRDNHSRIFFQKTDRVLKKNCLS